MTIGCSSISSRWTIGGSIRAAGLLRIWSILERTSSVAFCRSCPSWNWMRVLDAPCVTVEAIEVDIGEAGEGVLHRPGDLAFHLRRGGAVARHADQHRRKVDVGEILDRQREVGDQAGQHRGDEQHRHRHRVADRPGGNGEAAGSSPLRSARGALTRAAGRMMSPGTNIAPAFSTTREPAGGPVTSSTQPPPRSPVVTGARVRPVVGVHHHHRSAIGVIAHGRLGNRQGRPRCAE